ncbi:DUF1778 domain-containing protein [Mucilaginibacter sp. L3T2-6]|uniref:type II toxin-antitoxin system TacA family antitoxin n=1 Tax=Mucilaginibacter sp. L3T2-6 TaxID=3062491 RepID=UPI002676DCAB|nr:DUF1778 domain-containing protein [Mucilaginibacter sp. L3T2-6]MDO3641588.1 DUF1778 domain-containing protein [Mucilaginibacter sp. L3T2-6]MDV6214082.1 DUF1778 domain-containing protein [Mucilaginibacter sp. L3T2-6]
MENQVIQQEKARFDAKIPRAQKELFEYAASIGGYRTLTDFIINAVQEKANVIIREHDTIIASERDRATFFEAFTNPPEPNEKLKEAAVFYKKFIEENR